MEACVYPESWLQQWGYLALVTENIDGCTPNAFCKTKKMTWDAGGTQTVTFDNIRVPDRDTVDVTNGESAWDSNNKFQVLVGTYGKCGGPYYTNKMKPIVITPTTKDSCTTPAAEHGEKTCDGDNLERCDDGHWVLESPCPFGCDDGHWVLESPCTFGCENKACKTPGTTTTPTPTPTATPIPDCVVKDDCKAAASVTCDDGSIWYEPYDCVSGKCDIGQDAPPTDCIIVPVCADLFKDPGALLNDPLSDCNLPYTVGIVVALFVALIWFKNRKSGGSMGGINPF